MSDSRKPASTTATFGLALDAWGELELIDADGVRHAGVEPVRAFPLSEPSGWISIVGGDGRELAIVERLDSLVAATRELLESELARREFMPRIERIHSANAHTEPSEWEVDTDRGRVTFVLKTADDVRRLGPYRAILTDAHGVRYLLDDTRRLDGVSRKIVEHFL